MDTRATIPDDPAELRAKFLPIAIIAKIPPGNVDAFLVEVFDYVCLFEALVEGGRFVGQRRPAINGFMNAADRMIYAIDRLKGFADLKRELTGLRDRAKLMLKFPKRGTNSTNLFLRSIWLTARKFGGDLTYDKRTESGTLTKVIEFFKDMDGWETRSSSTLDRLRPRR